MAIRLRIRQFPHYQTKRKRLVDESHIIKTVIGYDGTFPGFLCAVHYSGVLDKESGIQKENLPVIISNGSRQPLLFAPDHSVVTDIESARETYVGLRRIIGHPGVSLLHRSFLFFDGPETGDNSQVSKEGAGRESLLVDYILRGMQYGYRICHTLGDPVVRKVNRFATAVERELNRFLGILRFSETAEGLLRADCSPRYNILPLMVRHFSLRMENFHWLIVDCQRGFGLFHFPGDPVPRELPTMEDVKSFCPESPSAETYPALWKQYFKTMEIRERKNSICQRNFIPLRDRTYMTEFL